MALIDDKKRVFGQIAAFRTLNGGLPEFNLSNSFPSINNEANSLDFLIDLLKSLIGFEELRDEVVDIITYQLDDIELEIKKTLKLELKSIVSCGVNPSLPEFFKTTGVDIRVNKVDFLDIMKINPKSENGRYIYDDYFSGVNSQDFNTYLYETIQTKNIENWGAQTTTSDILDIQFTEEKNDLTNVLNIKANSNYHDRKLTDLNNDYIDSISLFGSGKMINNIIDSIFGSLSVTFNKSRKQLENEEKINKVIECIINSEDDTNISDNFFTFSNEEIQVIEETAKNRRNGIKILETCDNIASSVPVSTLEDLANGLTGATTSIEKKEVISNSLNDMANISASNSSDGSNQYNIKLNFIELIIRKLMVAITNFIISPKVITIFLLNYKIIYGVSEEYDDAIDFLQKNKTLIRGIVNKIRDIILAILLKRVLKEVAILVAESAAKREIEKASDYVSQLLSLVGVNPDIIRLIKSLG
jgi:hypothetical protein